ncbi:hypothetical protein COLO4_33973 [Corchorus olitorius]|uniref:Uncharacterized protein n=1 Tax=Corchorus olitorius TaxID=93759 RepID=A0A1R3GPH6_9ROSI|nr:hypothetical protein COLO4_33973 [Corchorus olitorius]
MRWGSRFVSVLWSSLNQEFGGFTKENWRKGLPFSNALASEPSTIDSPFLVLALFAQANSAKQVGLDRQVQFRDSQQPMSYYPLAIYPFFSVLAKSKRAEGTSPNRRREGDQYALNPRPPILSWVDSPSSYGMENCMDADTSEFGPWMMVQRRKPRNVANKVTGDSNGKD